ncbi:MAG: hypothetical protein GY945_05090 [Rhodobacteraceae bacterium]|nr:hypothetical protein [Paracoccaceae bacterium]
MAYHTGIGVDIGAGHLANAPEKPCYEVNPTLWGYVLISTFDQEPPVGVIAMLRKILGVGLMIAAMALWLAPEAMAGAEIIEMKLALTTLYVALGTLFLHRARQVIRREVQVDLEGRELRSGFRNLSGSFSLECVHAFEDVDVVSLWDADHDPDMAWLLLQLADSDFALVAARGPKAKLDPYRVRLAKDLGAKAGPYDPMATKKSNNRTPLILGPRTYVSTGLAA